MKALDPHLLAGGARRVRISGSPGRARGQGERWVWSWLPKPLHSLIPTPTFSVTSWSCSSQPFSGGLVPESEGLHPPFLERKRGPDSLHGLDFCVHPDVSGGGGMRGRLKTSWKRGAESSFGTVCNLHPSFRVRVGSAGRKERLGRRERRDHQGLRAPPATTVPKGTL